MARTLFPLVLFLVLGSVSLHRAAAQVLVRPQPGQAVVPQALVPAQPPALPQAPGFVPSASASATPRPQVRAKIPVAAQPAGPIVPGTAKEPESTKVARIFRGTGSFDEALAERLKPMLAKTFAPSNNDRNSVSRTLQPASGKGDSAPGKDENPRKIAAADSL
ncbi:MAG: hypothetical protein WB696_26890 [Chthoniobacterales bacterium]